MAFYELIQDQEGGGGGNNNFAFLNIPNSKPATIKVITLITPGKSHGTLSFNLRSKAGLFS